MPALSKRFIYSLSNRIFGKKAKYAPETKTTINFAKTKKSPFNIKPESSFNSYPANDSLVLELNKQHIIAKVEIPDREYQDHIIHANFRLDSFGGYAAAGILFHIMDDESYYLALVSDKGYFRLDIVKNNSPKTLVAWTEISDFDGINIELKIIICGTYIITTANGHWVAETNDDSISLGQVGFALTSYETSPDTENEKYVCKAYLDYFSIDTRLKFIENEFKKWNDDTNINANSRLRLAETYAVMGESSKALHQITKAWKRRDEATSNFTSSGGEVRTKKELLLAARLSFRLEQFIEAEEFIDLILEQWADSREKKESAQSWQESVVSQAYIEKIKILNELNKFTELKDFISAHSEKFSKDIDFYTILARCHWELNEYEDSAEAWQAAFNLNKINGVYAANSGNALELANKENDALIYFIEAGKIFLQQDNKPELSVIMPKLFLLGKNNWEARALAGKWAFSIEDYDRCEAELEAAEKIRKNGKPKPKADPAVYYLLALVKNLKGNNKEAIRLLEKAVKLAPEYGLFRFKLAEIKITSGLKNSNRTLADLTEELKLALKDMDSETAEVMANHAANLLRSLGS